ncbi:MAG: sensor histidine kinase, partial [Candidatus Acidiferrales bacterium]
ANARQAQIELNFDAREARLYVTDDGRGFIPEFCTGSFGLTSMGERARALGGSWSVESEPGRGTQVRASIPLGPAIQ